MIGKKMLKLRTEKDLTQQDVADGIGILRSTYAHYEIDRREPDNEMLCRIARYFDVSADYLLGLSELRKAYVIGVAAAPGAPVPKQSNYY